MRKRFQKLKIQVGTDSYDTYCYVDMFCIESWEIEGEFILLHMDSGMYHRAYLTEEKMIKLFDQLNELDQ